MSSRWNDWVNENENLNPKKRPKHSKDKIGKSVRNEYWKLRNRLKTMQLGLKTQQ